MPRPRVLKPWEVEEEHESLELEKELDRWSLRDRFPLKPGQRHVEVPDGRPLGMQYGEDAEPIGQQIGSRIVALLASHVGSHQRLESLRRCLKSVEAQTERHARFLVSTSTDKDLAEAVVDAVEGSTCVDEHRDQGCQPLPQFEHYRRLRDVIREREEQLEDVWVFFSDDDDLWHPGRTAAFAAAVESVRRHVQRHIQAVCSCVHLRPSHPGLRFATAADVAPILQQMVNGPQVHGSEHVDLCVRFSTFSAFFEEHSLRIIRHTLADVRFSYFVRHYGELPRRAVSLAGHVRDQSTLVTEEDITDPERTVGALKVFLPEIVCKESGLNWMYLYDKVKDCRDAAIGAGGAVQIIRPDDEWYAADLENLVMESRPASKVNTPERPLAEGFLHACAALRQRLDFGIFRLPRQRPVALEVELFCLADCAARASAAAPLVQHCGADIVERWARSVVVLRCKVLKVDMYLSDFCAEGRPAFVARSAKSKSIAARIASGTLGKRGTG